MDSTTQTCQLDMNTPNDKLSTSGTVKLVAAFVACPVLFETLIFVLLSNAHQLFLGNVSTRIETVQPKGIHWV